MLPDPQGSPGAGGGARDEDSSSWLVTFSDLVLQLFGFAIIAALAGGAAARSVDVPATATPVGQSAVAVAAATAQPAERELPAVPATSHAAVGTSASDGLPVPAGDEADPDAVPVPPPVRAAAPAPDGAPARSVGAAAPRGDGLAALAAYLEHLVALQPALGATVSTPSDAVVVKIGELAGFAPGSAEPSPAMRPLLAELRALAGAATDLHVEVSGHTDDVPIKTAIFPSNLELSLARASRVASELVAGDAVLRARVSAAGYAEQRPIASNAEPEGRARNRRVEIRLSRAG